MGKESKQVLIYRCECPNYLEYGNVHEHPPYKKRDWMYLPTPEKDGIEYYDMRHVCGCNTLKQFSIWWPKGKWVTEKPNNQYLIFSVNKRYVKYCKSQVMFTKNFFFSSRRRHTRLFGCLNKHCS